MDLDRFFQENEDWLPYADLVALPPSREEILKEFKRRGGVNPEVLERCMEYTKEGGGEVTRGALYVRIRREDRKIRDSDMWATMLCLQSPPGLQTTDTFWSGRKTWVEHFGEDYANNIKANFARKGINVGPNQEYMPELVRPGFGPHNPDPEALVPFGGARSYIKKLCESRGWGAEGAINVKARQPESDPLADENCVPMGEDLVRTKGRLMMQDNPEVFKGKNRREAREMILAKHGPSKTKGRIVDVKDIGK
jgi:hypothetical protein